MAEFRQRAKKKPGEIESVSEAIAQAKRQEDWHPKTDAGKKVANGEITSLEELMKLNLPVREPRIIDALLPDLEDKVVDFKKTTKVRRSGRVFAFRAAVLIGDKNQYIGLGVGKDKERFPSIRKATRKAKLNMVKVRKGCGSWECTCGNPHSVPFKVEGKSASVKVVFIPAPKGTGLVAGDNIKDVLIFAGIRDVWCKTFGASDTKLNFVKAAVDALSQTTKMKISESMEKKIKNN